MYQPFPTDEQFAKLESVVELLKLRRNKSRNVTHDQLQKAGFTPVWRRVNWAGGVGSWRYMPKLKVVRIQISANEQANRKNKSVHLYLQGIKLSTRGVRVPNGFRYAYCVEV